MNGVRLPVQNFTTGTIVERRKCIGLLCIQVLTPSSGLLDFAISMRPDYHRAIIDTVRYYGWKKIIYLYDSHDGKSFTLRLSHAFLILQRVAAGCGAYRCSSRLFASAPAIFLFLLYLPSRLGLSWPTLPISQTWDIEWIPRLLCGIKTRV